GGYGIQLPGLDMPTKILTAVDTVRNITNGMKGIIQGRIRRGRRGRKAVIRQHCWLFLSDYAVRANPTYTARTAGANTGASRRDYFYTAGKLI
ncbi:hypothetical protein, partial [Janthinobacterium sp. LB2P70]|uniref:hypothetical protein n=1 Tax=Janthinobacterium sp. LB2P70 TaxID=3424197 RepID=UPI003F1EF398